MTCSDLTGDIGVHLSPLWLSILALQWLVTLLLVVSLGRSPRRRPLAYLFLFVSGASTLAGYSTRRALDVLTGIPDVSILAGHVLGVLAVMSTLGLMAMLTCATTTGRRQLRTAQAILGVGALCLIGLFLAVPRQLDHPDFGCWQARSPVVVTYQLIVQVCLGIGLLVAIMLFRPYLRTAEKRLLRNALRILMAGYAVGLVYVAQRCWYVVAQGFGLPYPLEGPRYGIVPVVLLESTLALIGLGAVIPGIYRIGLFTRRLVAHHRLRPLWAALTEAAPGNVLGTVLSPLADLVRVVGVERRLYRRTIEIRDAQWELVGFASPAMTESAIAALRDAGRHTGLAVEVLVLETARHAKLAGLPPTSPPDGTPWSGEADLDTEARILLAVRRLREDTWIQATAASIIRSERDRTTLANP